MHTRPFTAAEFFAGIGLVRAGLEAAGIEVVWANDLSPMKRAVYAANFGGDDYRLGDVREVSGRDVPSVDLATASFPCVDLSLAGHRRGLAGEHSGLFFEFTRILDEMGDCRPPSVLVENVPSFMSSRGGRDLRAAVADLNALGYSCALLIADSRWFVPQSRRRLFIVGHRLSPCRASKDSLPTTLFSRDPGRVDRGLQVVQHRQCEQMRNRSDRSPLQPEALARFLASAPGLMTIDPPLAPPSIQPSRLADVVEVLATDDDRWWNEDRHTAFDATLAAGHRSRVQARRLDEPKTWRTAYRRTRGGRAVWEVRADQIAGCLRTARGGSSRQALVEISKDGYRVRWMTAREYGRLQGVPDTYDISAVSEVQAMFGFGDAVCVPVITWLAREAIVPALRSVRSHREEAA